MRLREALEDAALWLLVVLVVWLAWRAVR